MVKGGVWMWVSMALLCLLIITSYTTLHYYQESLTYKQLYRESLDILGQLEENLTKLRTHMLVNILIDYGNGTREWHNETMLPIGATLLNATMSVAEVEYDVYPFGVFITAINGVSGTQNQFWIWYIWNSTTQEWSWGPKGADSFILHHGDTVKWVLQTF